MYVGYGACLRHKGKSTATESNSQGTEKKASLEALRASHQKQVALPYKSLRPQLNKDLVLHVMLLMGK